MVVFALLTVWERGFKGEKLKLSSFLYMVRLPPISTLLPYAALVRSPEASRVLVPSIAAPSMKVTLPVGIPAPGGTAETVMVKVTGSPYTEGLESESRVVVVSALFTVWERGFKGEKLKLSSPPYSAVMV